ncbi:MAG TPA: alpha/beta fold hydrolase [Allocoleopsis sp.]
MNTSNHTHSSNNAGFINWFKRNWKKMILTTVSCAVLGTYLIVEHILPYWPIKPLKRTQAITPNDFGLSYETLDIEAEKGLKLRGYLIHALNKKPYGTIIQLHGIGSCKENQIPFAVFLAHNNYNVVVYDQRAHGCSDGSYCTFGQYEKLDVTRFIDTISRRFPKLPVGIHGSSMGGAVALQALAYDKRLKFGIIESTFNTLENVVEEYGYEYFKFRSRWLARRILSKAALIANFNPFEIKPVEACKEIEQPILMAHGDMDEKIPIHFNEDNFKALKSNDKEFFVVKGANHNNVGDIGGEKYRQKILSFLRKVTAR